MSAKPQRRREKSFAPRLKRASPPPVKAKRGIRISAARPLARDGPPSNRLGNRAPAFFMGRGRPSVRAAPVAIARQPAQGDSSRSGELKRLDALNILELMSALEAMSREKRFELADSVLEAGSYIHEERMLAAIAATLLKRYVVRPDFNNRFKDLLDRVCPSQVRYILKKLPRDQSGIQVMAAGPGDYVWSKETGRRYVITDTEIRTSTGRSGGPAWRNNNPGNITVSKSHPRAWNPRIGAYPNKNTNGRFAIFPTYAKGKKGAIAWMKWKLAENENHTILSYFKDYAPASEAGNDPDGYATFVANKISKGTARLTKNSRLQEVVDLKLEGAFVEAQKEKEGWVVGEALSKNDNGVPADIKGMIERHDDFVRLQKISRRVVAAAKARSGPESCATKLKVDRADSPAEREADSVADDVSRPSAPALDNSGGDESPGSESTASPRIQAHPAPAPRPAALPAAMPGVVGRAYAKAGRGQPLRPALRHRLEPRLGMDLRSVRTHTDRSAHGASRALGARAFTVGHDIWLGAGESPDDVRLIAHEATHVVQQSQAGTAAVQRKPSDYRHPEDGGGIDRRLRTRFDSEIDEPAEADTNAPVDRSELREKRGEVAGETKPDVDRVAEEKPQIESSTEATKESADSPTEPIAEAEGEPEAVEGEGEGAGEALTAAGAAAATAGRAAAAVAEPAPEPQVETPEPVEPVDSEGEPLVGDPVTDANMVEMAERIQQLRAGGEALRAQAAEERGNAGILRSNLARVEGEIGKADAGIARAAEHTTARREIVSQAEDALGVSQEKAATVAAEAPGFSSKADEGKADSGPMSSEASQLSAENRANTPDDPEARAKAREQGGKIDSVQGDAVTMDDAVSQTRDKAQSLGEDAARATQLNAQTEGKIGESKDTLDSTDERLEEMRTESGEARAQVAGMAANPGTLQSGANALDAQGRALIAASVDLEERLRAAQESYEDGMSSVPGLEPWEPEEGEETGDERVQMLPTPGEEGRYEDRETVDVTGALPGWLTGVDPQSAADRETAAERERERRANEVDQINEMAGGRFENLSAADKVGIALQLTGQNFYNSIANIQWPGAGGLARMLLDPRTMLSGVTSGLSMMLSGGANLLSAEQWANDPLGNLLKSAADIATGLTIILGSITALAALIAAIMGALILVTFGAFSPIGLPVISVCTTIITTVGGWTIAVGKVALVLQALSLIKNLIDAATAGTAEDLQNQADQVRADTVAAGTVVLSIVGAKGAAAGIGRLRARALRRTAAARRAGGARALARRTAREAPGRIAAGARALPGRVAAGARAVGSRVAGAGAAVGRGVAGGARAIGRGVRSVRDRLRRRTGRGDDVPGRPPRRDVARHRDRVRESGPVRGRDLTPDQLDAELDLVRNARPRRSRVPGYDEEVRLPNGHTWRRRGRRWCRFSNGPSYCTLDLPDGRSARGIHDEFVNKVRPGARERTFETPWSSSRGYGTRRFDDFDDLTGTGFEGNTTPWARMTQDQLTRKLKQAADDFALLRTDPRVNRVIWFGTEPLPSQGLGGQLRRALEHAGIDYWVVVP